MNKNKALETLSLVSGVTKKEVKIRFRELAKMHHPDLYQNYPDQSEAVSEFIKIKEAYDFLMNHPSDVIIVSENEPILRAKKRDYATSYKLPDWLVLKEIKNAISLLRLIRLNAVINIFNTVQISSWFQRTEINERNYHARYWLMLWNLLKVLTISFIYLCTFILFTLAFFCFAICFVLFYPFLWAYNKSVNALMKLCAALWGYTPSPTCGRFRGEVIYLLARSLPVVALCILTATLTNQYYVYRTSFAFWALSPLNIFAFVMLSSIVYEWSCFLRIRKWRRRNR
ncbi:MAG TPA: DnaJ domain-containing protein [Bacteroidia bacterium]|nr:DnaJ domain-containing protein [Bacteroidia bacterium]